MYVFTDRIERVKQASRLSLTKAHRDAETIPMRSVGSVHTKKDGLRFTQVSVTTTGHPITFRMAHGDAQRMRDEIGRLILEREQAIAASATPTSPPPSAHSTADELRKLAELRDAGVLSADEFDAQKAKLLA